jgi:regulation of enolase protein 1 (concanavalin A-like superfamily)
VARKVVDNKWPKYTPPDDKAIYLRLQREGDCLLASVSQDGERWTELEPLDLRQPAKIKIGIAACSTSDVQFRPRFDDFHLTIGGGE